MQLKIYNSRVIDKVKIIGDTNRTIMFLLCSLIANKGTILDNVNTNKYSRMVIEFIKKINGEVNYISDHSLYIKPKKYNKLQSIDLSFIDDENMLDLLTPLAFNFSDVIIYNNKKLTNNYLKDYFTLENSFKALGLIFAKLYINRPLTIKSASKVPYIDIFNYFGFDVSYLNEHIYVHESTLIKWDEFEIKPDEKISDFYLLVGLLNGQIESVNFANSLTFKALIANKIRINNINDLYIANNQALLTKGISKKYNGIVSESLNMFLLVYASLATSLSIFNIKEKINPLYVKLLDTLKISYKLNQDKLIVYPKKDYQLVTVFDCYNNLEYILSMIIIGLINKGSLTLNNIDILHNYYPELLDNLNKVIKTGAIQVI